MHEVVLIVSIGTLLMLLLGIFITFLAMAYQKKRLEHHEEVKGLAASYQKEILEAQIEMQEQTFLSISQEIHDNVGQILSLARVNMNSLEHALTGPLAQKVTDSKDLVNQAIEDLRDLSKRLNSEYSSRQSLSALLKFQLGLIQKTGAAGTSFVQVGEEMPILPEKKLFVFRIAQEALNNSLKHSGADTITTLLEFLPGKLVLRISDDGAGFDANLSTGIGDAGTGLHNMGYRAALIGAVFRIHTSPGTGTAVTLTSPLT